MIKKLAKTEKMPDKRNDLYSWKKGFLYIL